METYTIEQIEAAVHRALVDPQKTESLRDYIIRELTRPKFSEGQVLLHSRNEFECIKVAEGDGMKYLNYRPLTQAEVGPDWVPREAAMKLRGKVDAAIDEGADIYEVCDLVLDALAEFDEVIKP